jgi:hypothetical protein
MEPRREVEGVKLSMSWLHFVDTGEHVRYVVRGVIPAVWLRIPSVQSSSGDGLIDDG